MGGGTVRIEPRLRSLVVIPARLESTRLPRKLLLRETGRTLLEHTWRAACTARRPEAVCVAVDDALLAAEVRRFGGCVEMTSPDCQSGTDRVAEVARRRPDVDLFVNVQADEPEIPGEAIDRVIGILEEGDDAGAGIATLATPIQDPHAILDPACVKVVFDGRGRALYFSRSPIPCVRDAGPAGADGEAATVHHQHVGLYAYRREVLLELAALPRSPLEIAENLEQLRALERGVAIQVGTMDHAAAGIDTRADYEAFVARARAG